MTTKKDNIIPKLEVHLERGSRTWLWVSGRCPFCGKKRHTHGGGRLDGDPRQLLGHRGAHCVPAASCPGGGYELVEEM